MYSSKQVAVDYHLNIAQKSRMPPEYCTGNDDSLPAPEGNVSVFGANDLSVIEWTHETRHKVL